MCAMRAPRDLCAYDEVLSVNELAVDCGDVFDVLAFATEEHMSTLIALLSEQRDLFGKSHRSVAFAGGGWRVRIHSERAPGWQWLGEMKWSTSVIRELNRRGLLVRDVGHACYRLPEGV